jgi:hypothetical protein
MSNSGNMKNIFLIIVICFSFDGISQYVPYPDPSAGEYQIMKNHCARVRADTGVIDDSTKITLFLADLYEARGSLSDDLVISGDMFGYKQTSGAQRCQYTLNNKGDFKQLTLANRPLFLDWNTSDKNYFINPLNATAGTIYAAHSVTYNSITNQDILIKINVASVAGAEYVIINRMGAAGNKQFKVAILAANIRYSYSIDGTAVITASTSPTSITTGLKWYRIKRTSSNGDVDFYSAANSATIPTSWTLLDHETSANTGALKDVTYQMSYGTTGIGILHKIYQIKVYSGFHDAGGTLVSEMNPNYYHADSATSGYVDSTTNESFTINRSTAVSGYLADIVYRPTTFFDAVDDRLVDTIAYNGALTVYFDSNYPNGYEIGTSTQYLGYKGAAYTLAKTGLIMVFKGTDMYEKVANMQSLYSNKFYYTTYYLNPPYDPIILYSVYKPMNP